MPSSQPACALCEVPLRPYATLSGALLREAFYTAEVQRLVPELSYGKCPQCGSLFATDARRDPELLARTYAALPDDYWQPLAIDTHLQKQVARTLEELAPGRDLCDVGCGDGAWLASFGKQWRRFGIEPGAAAAEQCRQRGLNVHTGSAADVNCSEAFDALTCIDVTEHLLDPRNDLKAITRLLRQDGLLVIFTGDPTCWTARLAGAAWQYLHCVGHVSILSRRALSMLLSQLGFDVLTQQTLNHASSSSLWRWLSGWWSNRRRLARGKTPHMLPYFHDHQFIIARRVRLADAVSSPVVPRAENADKRMAVPQL